MIIFRTVKTLQQFLSSYKRQRVGFVPTMGALHKGHISLVEQAKSENELSVCSIYVNPTQFNEASDLQHYPRTLSADLKKLAETGCDVVFIPDDQEIYPEGMGKKLALDLSDVMSPIEGVFRPGHFEGMVQVVHRFLEIVQPDRLYMGQKDYQQFIIVQTMVERLKMGVDVIPCPIVREPDGLAMSSRNLRLTPESREKAVIIHNTLRSVQDKVDTYSDLEEVQEWAIQKLSIDGFRPEYFEIVNARTLKSVKKLNEAKEVIACTAIWAGDIRLIDNTFLKKNS